MIQQLDNPAIQEWKEVVKQIALRSLLEVVGDAVLPDQVLPGTAAEAVAPDSIKAVLPQDRRHFLRGCDGAERRSPLSDAADDAAVALAPRDRQGEAVPAAPASRIHEGVVGPARLIRQHRAALHGDGLDGFGADVGL